MCLTSKYKNIEQEYIFKYLKTKKKKEFLKIIHSLHANINILTHTHPRVSHGEKRETDRRTERWREQVDLKLALKRQYSCGTSYVIGQFCSGEQVHSD